MLLGGLVDCILALLISSICTTELAANAGCPLRLHVSASFSPTKPQHIYLMCHPQTVQVGKKIELFHILLAAKKFESPEYQSTVDGQATAPTMSDTIVITVPGDNSLIGKSCPIQWPATRKGLQTGTPTIEGIESVMFTYRFMEDRPGTYCTCGDQDPTTMFTDVQESEAGSAHSEHDAVNVPNGDEGQTRYGIPRTAEKVMAYTLGGRGHAALACPEAQLMAGNSVIYLNDEGPVERLLRWVAGICGGRDHVVYACPEAQLMADCPVIRLNEEGPIGWLLR